MSTASPAQSMVSPSIGSPTDLLIDVHPDDPSWGHGIAPVAEGVELHYVRQGTGETVILLHGWPGFWYDWRRLIPLLRDSADVIAPDLRGFGGSTMPPPASDSDMLVTQLASDIVALMDRLGVADAVVVGHDIGARIAQQIARQASQRVRALVLFNPPYAGIGDRFLEPLHQRERWYQYFHHLPWSHELVGHDRETLTLYLAHFYDHWVGRKDAVRPREFDGIVDTYSRPDVVRAGFDYYRVNRAQASREGSPATLPRMDVPTTVLWGEADPILPVEWSDRLSDCFTNVSLERLPGIGHFVAFEAPEEAAEAIRSALHR
jgi:pimeloyl-ACP methyl ester carboxylesterase